MEIRVDKGTQASGDFCLRRAGFQYPDFQQSQTQALILVGRGRPILLWSLGTLVHSQQIKQDHSYEAVVSPSKLFSLALSILHLWCHSILGQAKVFLRTRLYQRQLENQAHQDQ